MGPVNPRNSQYFTNCKRRKLYWTYPHIRGKELGEISRNAADSQPGVSRYDQKPWVGVRRGKFVNELVKGCHTRPFGCSYVVWLDLSLQDLKSIRIVGCLSVISSCCFMSGHC